MCATKLHTKRDMDDILILYTGDFFSLLYMYKIKCQHKPYCDENGNKHGTHRISDHPAKVMN